MSLVALAACAGVDDGVEGRTADSVVQGRKVAGFDFGGLQTLSRPAGAEVCPEVVDAVAARCEDAGGVSSAAKGCRTLCSVPIADSGKVAGYDFSGLQTRGAPTDAIVVCPAIVTLERAACEAAQGRIIRTDGCDELCSVPIAENGKVAGYDFSGVQTRGAPTNAIVVCPAIVTLERAACEAAQGRIIRTDGCDVLCSVPIAR